MEILKQSLKELHKNQKKMNELFSNSAKLDRAMWYMTFSFKRSTSENEEKKRQEVTTESRGHYDKFTAVNDQHSAESMKSKKQIYIEADVGHKLLPEDTKSKVKQVMVEDKLVALEQPHEDAECTKNVRSNNSGFYDSSEVHLHQ